MKKAFIIIGLIFVLSFSLFAQSKKKTATKTAPKTTATAAVTSPPPVAAEPEVIASATPAPTPPKKNERPASQTSGQEKEPKKKNQAERGGTEAKPEKIKYPYVYEFSQPNFVVSHIVIEHDENGKGTITFEKKEAASDPISDPIQLTQKTLDRINKLFETLNFVASTEEYQSPVRDYGHLGNYTVTMRRDAQERTVKYNWTENKDAKALVEEYRKISEQYIWYFDMNISRENQPLEAPTLVDRLDSLLKRNEISDPAQMLPYLKEVSNDERIPLIARNHVARIIKEIEKTVKK
jgi:hypothetical protein